MIGFLINDGQDQTMIKAINAIHKEVPTVVFSGSLLPGLQTNTLQRLEAFHFNGNVITSSLKLSQQLKHLGYAKNRFLYVKDFEWMKINPLYLSQLEETIFSPNVELIANTEEDAEILSSITNKEVNTVMHEWSLSVLKELAYREASDFELSKV